MGLSNVPGVGDLLGVRLRRNQNKTAAMIAKPTTPPTTPPTIAPVLSLEEDEELAEELGTDENLPTVHIPAEMTEDNPFEQTKEASWKDINEQNCESTFRQPSNVIQYLSNTYSERKRSREKEPTCGLFSILKISSRKACSYLSC